MTYEEIRTSLEKHFNRLIKISETCTNVPSQIDRAIYITDSILKTAEALGYTLKKPS